MSLDSGTHLSGRYEILSTLGAGGMGEVYRAKDLLLGREVAVKVLPDHLCNNPQAMARFEREAKALAALSHTNILAIYDYGTHQGISFAVMELLKGATLRSRLADSKLNWKKAAEMGIGIAEGVAAAHSAGVIHRDLKPENIFITLDSSVKILDFGLARWQETTAVDGQTSASTMSHTEPGAVMGTLGYMSPEQVRGESLDERTDIFSIGCVLHEMVSGARIFARKTPADTISAILNDNPPRFSKSETIPVELERLTIRCLQKDPKDRFQSTHDLVFDLKTILSGSTLPDNIIVKGARRASLLRPAIWMTITLLLLLAGTFFYLFVLRAKPIHSLAILPFSNVTADPNTEYLSDGISESIINNLSQLSHLRVMAHDTVFTYKDKKVDPRKVGRDLNVEAVVTGRVMQQGNTLIIRTALVRAEDGTELWGQQYNRKLADVLAIQEEISHEISQKLQLRLTGEEEKLVTKPYTKNSEAYQLYLRGRYHLYKDTPDDHQKSIEYFRQAIERDPNYALAYVGLALTYDAIAFEGLMPPDEAFEEVQKAADKALEIDDTVNEVYGALGAMSNGRWNFAQAESYWERSKDVYGQRLYSVLLISLGQREKSIALMKKVLEMDPLSREANKALGARYFWAGQYDHAIEQLQKTIELDPHYPDAHDLLADVYARKAMYKESIAEEQEYLNLLGDMEGAKALGENFQAYGYQQARRLQFQRTLDYLKEAAKEGYVSPVNFAQVYALLNEKDEAFAWLEKCYEERSPWLVFLKMDPQYDNLRSDPRLADLLKRIGLPQ